MSYLCQIRLEIWIHRPKPLPSTYLSKPKYAVGRALVSCRCHASLTRLSMRAYYGQEVDISWADDVGV